MPVLEFEYCASLWVTVKPACSKSESKDFSSDFTCLLPLSAPFKTQARSLPGFAAADQTQGGRLPAWASGLAPAFAPLFRDSVLTWNLHC